MFFIQKCLYFNQINNESYDRIPIITHLIIDQLSCSLPKNVSSFRYSVTIWGLIFQSQCPTLSETNFRIMFHQPWKTLSPCIIMFNCESFIYFNTNTIFLQNCNSWLLLKLKNQKSILFRINIQIFIIELMFVQSIFHFLQFCFVQCV